LSYPPVLGIGFFVAPSVFAQVALTENLSNLTQNAEYNQQLEWDDFLEGINDPETAKATYEFAVTSTYNPVQLKQYVWGASRFWGGYKKDKTAIDMIAYHRASHATYEARDKKNYKKVLNLCFVLDKMESCFLNSGNPRMSVAPELISYVKKIRESLKNEAEQELRKQAEEVGRKEGLKAVLRSLFN